MKTQVVLRRLKTGRESRITDSTCVLSLDMDAPDVLDKLSELAALGYRIEIPRKFTVEYRGRHNE